jgi:hypothetical protein
VVRTVFAQAEPLSPGLDINWIQYKAKPRAGASRTERAFGWMV